jgi:Na+-transporting NADH:ubiquinone oxidoreductase subunit F
MHIVLLALSVTTGLFVALTIVLLIAEKYLANYGICKISINDGSKMIEKKGGITLLTALYENKIFIPSACGGKGSCGFCKVTVDSGGGPILPTETSFISRKEQKAGMRLACQVKVKEDMELKISEDMLNVKEFKAKVSKVVTLTENIKEVNFELEEPNEIEYRPGQYIQILAIGPDGPIFRAYSISCPSEDKNKMQLIVRHIPGGIASTYIHSLKEGDDVMFTGPFGEFELNQDPETSIVCVGGGAGMAPISNIIHHVYRKWPERECFLFFGCRSTKDIFYLDKFEELKKQYPKLKVIYALSDPVPEDGQWSGDTGFIHLSVDKHLQENKKCQAFMCGPPPMIEAATEILQGKGLKEQDIFYDKF